MERYKRSYWLTAILTAILGVILVIWPDMSIHIFCTGIGIAIAVSGIYNIVQYMLRDKNGFFSGIYLVLGILLTIIGCWLFFSPESLLSIIPTIVGVFLLIHGAIDLGHAMSLKNMGYGRWWLGLLLSILTIVAAIVIINNPFSVISSLVMLIGFALIFDGIKDIALLILVGRTRKRMKQDIKNMEIIDVDILDEKTFRD